MDKEQTNTEECPNLGCGNQGWYPIQVGNDRWEQEPCEFCYTAKTSVFNTRHPKEEK